MLSDAKLGHFEVITPQQYNGYPWCQGWSQIGIRSKFVRFDSKIDDSIDSKRQKKFEKFDNFQFEIRSIRKKIIRKIRKFFKFNFLIRKI